MNDPFRVVVVCSGNRFRSPLAAALLSRSLTGAPFAVESAGTLDLGAVPPLPEALSAARAFGLDLEAHRARHVRAAPLSRADLVLGFERMHVLTAVSTAGAHRDRTFTLPELVELLRKVYVPRTDDAVARARAALGEACRIRRRLEPRAPEIPDPLGQSSQVQQRIAERIKALCGELTVALFPESRLTRR